MRDSVRVLFVDDEENIRKAIRRMFRKQDWDMEFVASGAEALEKFNEGPPFDVVVSDQRMPGMTGVELLKQLRERHPKTVRMILSAYTDAETVIDAINEGYVYKFLTKSCTDTVLREAVTQVVETVRLARENQHLNAKVASQVEEIAAVDWLAGELEEVDVSAGDPDLGNLAFDAAPLGLLLLDGDATVLTANPEALRILAVDGTAALVGKQWNPASAEKANVEVRICPCGAANPGMQVVALVPDGAATN